MVPGNTVTIFDLWLTCPATPAAKDISCCSCIQRQGSDSKFRLDLVLKLHCLILVLTILCSACGHDYLQFIISVWNC